MQPPTLPPQSNSEQGLRLAKMTEKQLSRNRMGSIDTWSFGEGTTSYAERFELAVGCSPARYAEIVDPKALLDLRNDAAGYAAAQRRAREVGECKAELCVLLVLEAIACPRWGARPRLWGSSWQAPAP